VFFSFLSFAVKYRIQYFIIKNNKAGVNKSTKKQGPKPGFRMEFKKKILFLKIFQLSAQTQLFGRNLSQNLNKKSVVVQRYFVQLKSILYLCPWGLSGGDATEAVALPSLYIIK
jgi:hypothetical protein